jgi:riboflavin transporter FmnP
LKPSPSRNVKLAGTALLAALVVVFDYALKFSGLKIPFPWMPMLKFDFTGVPIALSLLLFGLPSAGTTSLVAGVAIVARSGDVLSASMKVIAEFTTVLGMWAGLALASRMRAGRGTGKAAAYVLGVLLRVIDMGAANLVVMPAYYGIPYPVAVGMTPLIAAFNVAQGSLTVLLGYFLHEAYLRRVGNQLKA